MNIQWWLATLDQYGNPTLVDGAHLDRAGVDRAMEIYRLVNFLPQSLRRRSGADGHKKFAVARIELTEISDK